MGQIVTVAVIATLALACGEGAQKSNNPARPGPAKPAPAPADAKPVLAEPATMFRGDAPDLPPPLQALRLGMSAEEVAAAPVYEHLRQPKEGGSAESKLYRGVRYSFGSRWASGRITQITVSIDDHDSREALEDAWGGAHVVDRNDRKRWWFNADKRVQVELTEQNPISSNEKLRFELYIPLADLIDESGRMSFERIPLVGSTTAEVAEAYPEDYDANPERPTVTVAPIEFNRIDTPVRLHLRKERVVGYEFLIRYEGRPGDEEYTWALDTLLPERFEASLGAPKKRGKKLVFDTKPRVALERDPEVRSWRVTVGK
jgi:hypothetical protein